MEYPGYHFRGQKPYKDQEGVVSKLARKVENEDALTLSEKYNDLYFIRKEVCSETKRTALLTCMVLYFFILELFDALQFSGLSGR